MQLLLKLALADLQFLADEVFRAVDAVAQHVADGQELWFLVADDTAVGRDVDLAVGEGIEGVNRLVRRYARSQMYHNLDVCRCQVVDAAGLDLALLNGLRDTLTECGDRFRERQFADDERLLVDLLDLGAHLQHTAALTVVVFRDVDAATRLEVGVELELLVVQVADGGVADLAEVMWHDLRTKTHGNALGTLCQQ